MPLPLDGLRIVNAGTGLAAGFAAKLLAQYGADVIDVEPPGGDPLRREGPFLDDEPGSERSLLYNWLHAGRRSVTLNLDDTNAAAACRALLRNADVLIDTARAGEARRRGLDQPALEEEFPRLVVASITPFGLTGPYADYAATATTLHALGGWVHPMGEPDRPPVAAGPQLGLAMTGVYAAIGVLEALRLRDEVGGQTVEVSAQEVIAATMIYDTVAFQYTGTERRRGGPNLFPNVVNLGIHPARDGWVGVFAPLSWQVRALFDLMEMPQALEDERFRTPETRIQHADEFSAQIDAWTSQQDSVDFYHRTQAARLPFNFHPTAQQVYDSPQLAAREYWDRLPDAPQSEPGRSVPGLPFRLRGTLEGGRELEPAPRPGQHSAELLTEAGLGMEAVHALTGGAS
jgi:crotonobetainyl-CoA:carnitine CoA-transferase CaiB-like acyl-CoA transferase